MGHLEEEFFQKENSVSRYVATAAPDFYFIIFFEIGGDGAD